MVRKSTRLGHAHELLGKSYKKSGVQASESVGDISQFVFETTKKFLPAKAQPQSLEISQAILNASAQFHFDPVFLMAVIQNESSFNPKRVGSVGEIGLMQVRPATAEWISKRFGIYYKDAKSLYDPARNILIGSALLSVLRKQFDSKSTLYLSAYNMGASKTRQLVKTKVFPKSYVNAVMRRYLAMYSAFKVKGDWKARGQVAYLETRNLTL